MSRSRHRIDLSFGPGHGPVSGVLVAAGAMLGFTMWAWLFDESAWWGTLTGVGMAIAGAGTAIKYDQRNRVVVYRGLCWLLAGAWSCWVLVDFRGIPLNLLVWRGRIMEFWSSPAAPWTMTAILPLVVGAAIVACIGWSILIAEKKEEQQKAQLEAERAERLAQVVEAERVLREPMNEEEAIGDRWQPVLRQVTGKKIRIANVEIWPRGGFTLDCQLPDDGTVVSDIKGDEEALAAAAPENPVTSPDGRVTYQGLGDGCSVEITSVPGLGRRVFAVKVSTSTALGEDIPYPDDLSMESVENPVVLGVEAGWRQAAIPMRYETTVLVGDTDSGKSNQLNVITTGLARCSDALLVGIDLSGNGRMIRPWIREYAEGRVRRPTFAQVAHTPLRAQILCQSLINITNGRTADYADLINDNDWDKIMLCEPPVNRQFPRGFRIPQLVLVVDEGKTLPDQVKEMIETIVETGRGAAVRVVYCALEATTAAVPRPVVKNARNRISMRVGDEAELQYLFDKQWSRGRFDPASMPWKGSGMYANGPVTPSRFKGYRIAPDRVRQVSTVTAKYRPDLDELSLRRGDTVTISVMTPDGWEDRTYDGVWTNADADTYPEIFPNNAAIAAAAGGSATTLAGGTTATLTKGMPKMITNPNEATAAGFAGIKAANTELDDVMRQLQETADSGTGGLTPDEIAAAAAEQDDTGDGEDPAPGRPAGTTPAGAPDMSADHLNALWQLPAVEPVRPNQQPTPPAGPEPSAPPADGVDGYELPANPVGESGRPAMPPKKRILQHVWHRRPAGGIGPTGLHGLLIAEGYTINITTVQTTLREFKARGWVVQSEPRQPYLPGPKFPQDRL